MRIAPAVGPFSIKIVRMVRDTAHLSASPSLILSSEPEGQPYQCKKRVGAQFNFATPHKNSRNEHSQVTGATESVKVHTEDMRANSTIRLLAISRIEVAKSSIIQSIRCSTRVSPLSKPDQPQAASEIELVLSER